MSPALQILPLTSNIQDAFAILLAAHHPDLHLLGISSVFGNASLSHTTHNAAAVLTAIGRKDVPLYRGSEKALERAAVHAPEVHGESGLEGTFLLPKPECEALSGDAVEAMYSTLIGQPKDTAWLVATGSLTNVAKCVRAHPDLIDHLKGISIMGGSIGDSFSDAYLHVVDGKDQLGNIGRWAEFNILIDPEAAATLFHDDKIASKITLVPLDLSHQVLATNAVRQLILQGPGADASAPTATGKAQGKTTLRTMFVELLNFASKTYENLFGGTDGYPVHDPVAVAAVLIGTANEIPFTQWHEKKSVAPKHDERFKIKVVTEGTIEQARDGTSQTGRTIATPVEIGGKGVRIPRTVDVDRFWSEVEKCVERADAINKAEGKEFWAEVH